MKTFMAFTRQAFHNTAIYRFEFWLQLISIYIMMYSVYWIWNVLYKQSPGIFNTSLEQMVTYGVLGMALLTILGPNRGVQWYISNHVRTGFIDTDLLKPMDFFLHMLLRQTGETIFRLVFILMPSLFAGFLFLHLTLPRSLTGGIMFLVSLIFAYLIQFSLSFLLGLLSMLTLDIRSISWSYQAVMRFFSGQMIPLWLFKGFWGSLAGFLPFRCIFSVPISIYIGELSERQALQGILTQILWAVALILLGRFAWVRVQRRLVVQGG